MRILNKRPIAFALVALFNSLLLIGCDNTNTNTSTNKELTQSTWKMPVDDAPLGYSGLSQTITSQPVTAGVTYYQVKRGELSADEYWTVNIGFYTTPAAAQADADAINAAGFTTRLDQSAGTNTSGATLGYYLSVDRFNTQDEANAVASQISVATANKYKPRVRNTALAGNTTTGPWIINILAIEPAKTTAKLSYELPGGNNLGGAGETVSAAALRVGALAGMNAGYFSNINPFGSPLPPRSPVGTTVVNGQLVAAATGGRPGVMITTTSEGHPKATLLQKLSSSTILTDDQSVSIEVKDKNRPILGTVVNCGTPAQTPTTLSAHDYVCNNFNDLKMYDSLFLGGLSSNTLVNASYKGDIYELVVDSTNTVVGGDETLGTPAPQGGYVLQGLGDSAKWLREHAIPGTKLTVVDHVYSDGKEITLAPGMSIVEAGPTLSVSNLLQNAWAEGFSPIVNGSANAASAGIDTSTWYEGWVVSRNGRTAIGVGADGTILLVEIPGRQPYVSLGTSIPETAAVMAWLGASSSINLDGGGSSNMVVNSVSVGEPSDATGERGVAGTLMITSH
ncbi:exopolysaccharide biosynthesis protein related to N-acetylglucosamine-1-phosphodiester alpha-N-acetylglucosaminidase [Serratia sp. DD3]|nr:exopolysaccharide biosynthesis protein related to N-acetylglucosamine-1-phosphodiester alpha-N-acetylglucosaminidase [Serratia sp. DD3]